MDIGEAWADVIALKVDAFAFKLWLDSGDKAIFDLDVSRDQLAVDKDFSVMEDH